MNKSKNTTIGGILQFLVVALTEAQSLFDGDALTNPNWSLVVTSAVILIALIKAKDSGISGTE